MSAGRYAGHSKTQIAMACCLGAKVGFPTAYDVLFRNKPVKSPATQRVVQWAQANGVAIGGQPSKAETKASLEEIDAMLEAAEKKLASG
jgi:hypothetical protein